MVIEVRLTLVFAKLPPAPTWWDAVGEFAVTLVAAGFIAVIVNLTLGRSGNPRRERLTGTSHHAEGEAEDVRNQEAPVEPDSPGQGNALENDDPPAADLDRGG